MYKQIFIHFQEDSFLRKAILYQEGCSSYRTAQIDRMVGTIGTTSE